MFIKTNINWKVDFFLSGIDLGTIPVDISVDISKTSFKVSKQPSQGFTTEDRQVLRKRAASPRNVHRLVPKSRLDIRRNLLSSMKHVTLILYQR